MGVLRTVRITILARGKSSPSKVEENPWRAVQLSHAFINRFHEGRCGVDEDPSREDTELLLHRNINAMAE